MKCYGKRLQPSLDSAPRGAFVELRDLALRNRRDELLQTHLQVLLRKRLQLPDTAELDAPAWRHEELLLARALLTAHHYDLPDVGLEDPVERLLWMRTRATADTHMVSAWITPRHHTLAAEGRIH